MIEIEKTIHNFLTGTIVEESPLATLASLIPISRITFGKAWKDREVFPYITISLENNQKAFYSNVGQGRIPGLRFTLFDDDHSRGCSIRKALVETFDNVAIGSILSMRHENDFAIQDDDEIWQFTIDFELFTYE